MPASYVETRLIPVADLTRYPGNARRGDVPAIRESIRRHGQYRSLIVRDTGDTLVILAGNNTHEALAAEGHPTARCEVIECTDDEAQRIVVADNRLSDLGGYDDRALAELLASLDDDFFGTGYDSFQVDDLFKESGYLGDQATAFLADLTEPEPVVVVPNPAPAPVPGPAPVGPPPNPGPPPAPNPAAPPGLPPQPAPTPIDEPPPWNVDDNAPAAGRAEFSNPDLAAAEPQVTYVPVTWTVPVDDRNTIREALTAAQRTYQLKTTADALVFVCRAYLYNTQGAPQ